MRRYDMVTGILLILSIIDFALAAPVLVQENQARVDVVHIPKDVRTVLGKRWEEEVEKLGEEYFKTSGKSIDSSGTHSSSSTAPNIASSEANPDSKESPCSQLCSSSTTSMQGLSARGPGSCLNCLRWLEEWWREVIDPPQRNQVTGTVSIVHTPRPNPNPNPNSGLPINPSPDFNYLDYLDHLMKAEEPSPLDSPSLKPVPHKEDSEGSQSPGQGSPVTPPEKEEEVLRPPSSPIRLMPESYSAASQPVDFLAVTTAMKGKAKESDSSSGTTSDASDDWE